MSARRLLWKVLPAYILVISFALAGFAWFGAAHISRYFYEETKKDLEAVAWMAASRIGINGPEWQTDEASLLTLNHWCRSFSTRTGLHLRVVLPEGKVVCDSYEEPASLQGQAERLEFWEALNGRVGTATLYNHVLEQRLLYVAVPIEPGVSGAVRVGVPVSTIQEILWGLRGRFFLGVLIILAAISVVTLRVVSLVVTPLRQMKSGAESFARGDFSSDLPIPKTMEFASLAEEMNRMASQLDDRIRTVINQRNELEAVMSSMVEGVLAFDTDQRLISLNHAASELLNLDPTEVQNRDIHEIIRNSEFQKFVGDTLEKDGPVEGEIILYHKDGERHFQAHGTPLKDTCGKKIGALVVLNDVTRIRRLENIRRDFVANASHEIRTPITSIKGFVETLLDGALNERETAERFLGIIKKHSDRLDAIVQDLLSLSRIEKEAEKGEVFLEEGSLREVLEEAVEASMSRAEASGVTVEIDCPGDLKARISPSLLIQAVINLVDNAIKYSEKGSPVRVVCSHGKSGLMISVQDWGAGIDKRHIPRLFERFYRVDKARSRTLGGTGLGLAIVKHIVQVHNGEIKVQSEPGKGSTFTIILPS